MNKIYDFEEQLELGKHGEKKMFSYLNNLSDTILVLNLAEHNQFQTLGIDGMLITDPGDSPFVAEFFDIKTDFQYYRTGKLFIEIYADAALNKEGGILSTKAQVFYYYDPFGGILFKIPIFALRRWYHREGISMNHKTVKNNFGQDTVGLAVAPEDLDRDGVPIVKTKIGSLTQLGNVE